MQSEAPQSYWRTTGGAGSQRLTFEISGAPTAWRQAWAVENVRAPTDQAWWHAVGAPLERGVRPHRGTEVRGYERGRNVTEADEVRPDADIVTVMTLSPGARLTGAMLRQLVTLPSSELQIQGEALASPVKPVAAFCQVI
jgi:hypothetical protein